MTSNDLKSLIEREARLRNWSPATFCKNSVGNNRLHQTLNNGGSCTLDIAERLIAYIDGNPPYKAVS